MFGKSFWVSTAERSAKSFCQTLLIIWPISDAALGLLDVDWEKAFSIAGMAALASILTSIVSAPVGPDGSPSLVGEPPKEPAALVDGDEAEQPVDKPRHDLDGDPGELPAVDFFRPGPRP